MGYNKGLQALLLLLILPINLVNCIATTGKQKITLRCVSQLINCSYTVQFTGRYIASNRYDVCILIQLTKYIYSSMFSLFIYLPYEKK